MTLRWRLTLLYVGATAIVFFAALFTLRVAYRRGLISSADRTLLQAMDQASEMLETDKKINRLPQTLRRFEDTNDGLFLWLFDPDNHVLFQSDPDMPELTSRLSPSQRPAEETSRLTLRLPHKREMRVIFFPLASFHGFRLAMGTMLPESSGIFSGWQTSGIVSFFVTLVLALGWTGWWISGRALRPIDRITQVAEAVGRGALEERIPPSGMQDELGRLIGVLNHMLERVESATKKLQHFSSNVSHQLKTPLTVLRGEIEVTLRGQPTPQEMKDLLESQLAELEGLSHLVEDLLAYARAEGDAKALPTPQRLDLFVETIAKKAQVLCRAKQQTLTVCFQPVTALFHAGRLEQALLNILDNAVKHAPIQGEVRLQVEADAGQAWVRVEDTGPGVSEHELPRLFERGRSRSSTGIGLGLAKALVESFSGTLKVLSKSGQGLQVLVCVPKLKT